MNKALDYNKLLFQQRNGKLLNKKLSYPMIGQIKYDGNYTTVVKENGKVTFLSSGGIEYTNNYTTEFESIDITDGAYICERIGTDGKLGDRVNCSLKGKRGEQVAYDNKFVVHDYLMLEDYYKGSTDIPYIDRYDQIPESISLIGDKYLNSESDMETYAKSIIEQGYEGIVLKRLNWLWRRTNSRTIDFVKYKLRPTADLLVVDVTYGKGKYTNMIGALILRDSEGRIVSVGSGLTDFERSKDGSYWVGKIVEIEYEQIINTYIQPTFVRVREDKGLI